MPLEICSDLTPAAWIQGSDIPWWQLVTFGPAGFAAYARLRLIPDPAHEGQSETDVTAEEIRSEANQWRDLVELLADETTDPEDCYFALWEGWGFPESTRQWPRFSIPRGVTPPARSYFLFHGSLSQVGSWGRDEFGHMRDGHEIPALAWPADHAWCVAEDIDPHWAGIGGDPHLIQQLTAQANLDIVAADPDSSNPPTHNPARQTDDLTSGVPV